MIGTRKDNPNSEMPSPGDYGRDANGDWYGMTPNGHLANLAAHQVVEHDDQTITVSPSILVKTYDKELWHGHLIKGVWENCGKPWKTGE